MFPTLRPGDKVLVSPISEKISPVPGDIIVIIADDILILHRLIEICNDKEGNKVFITRGDSMNEYDPPVTSDQIVGTAGSFRRNNNGRSLRCRIPSKSTYKFNRVRLWGWVKMKKSRG